MLDQLREVQDAGDAESACREIYVIREPERPSEEGAAGEVAAESEAGEEGMAECEDAFKKAVALRRSEITDLSTSVGSIEVDGDAATAIVHTGDQAGGRQRAHPGGSLRLRPHRGRVAHPDCR